MKSLLFLENALVKEFENQPIFDEDEDTTRTNLDGLLFGLTVYNI